MESRAPKSDAPSYEHSLSIESQELYLQGHIPTKERDIESRPSSQSSLDSSSPVLFSEGGLRGYLTVLGGAMVSFCTFGVVQSFGVYQDYYTRSFLTEKSPSQISWIGSVQVFLVFSIGLPAGKLMDSGYFHHTTMAGMVIYTVSIFMLSLIKPNKYYQTFLAQGVGMGLGMGMMFLPSLTLTSHYFRKRRSLAMGAVVSGASIGGLLYPILLNNVLTKTSRFGWGVRAVGFIDLGLLLAANALMRPRLPPNKNMRPAPLTKVVNDVPFLGYILGIFLVFWGVFVPFFYLQLYAVLHGVDKVFAKYTITIMNAASLFGRIVPNLFADHYGPLNVLIVSSVVSGALIFVMFGAKSIGGVSAFAIFYGFFSGGAVSLAAPAVGSFVTSADLSDLGIRIGVVSFALAFSLLTGNPIAGVLLTSQHHWERPLIFAAVVVLSGASCHLLLWKSLASRKGTRVI